VPRQRLDLLGPYPLLLAYENLSGALFHFQRDRDAIAGARSASPVRRLKQA
jgi:hypothetical protein